MLNQKKKFIIATTGLLCIKSIFSLNHQYYSDDEYINNMAEAPMNDLLQFQALLTSMAHEKVKKIRNKSQNMQGRSRKISQNLSPFFNFDEIHQKHSAPIKTFGSCIMKGIFIMSLTASMSTLLFVIGVMLYQALWEKIEQSRGNHGYTHLPDEEDPEEEQRGEPEPEEEEEDEEIQPPTTQPEKKKKKKFCNPILRALKGTLHHPPTSDNQVQPN